MSLVPLLDPVRRLPPMIEVGGVALTIVGAAVFGTAFALWTKPLVACVALMLGGLCLVTARPWTLLVLSVAIVCFLPLEAVSTPTWVRQLPLAVVPLAVVLVRARVRSRAPLWPLMVAAIGVGWIVASFVLQPTSDLTSRIRSAAWGGTLAICVFGPVTGPRVLDRRTDVETALIAILALLGAGAMVEAFVLHANPVFDGLYHSGTTPIVQKWASYRATTSLGHPLVNGLAFSVGLVLCLGRLLGAQGPARARLAGAALLLAGGVVATQSRGAMAAVVIGIALLIVSRQRSSGSLRRKLLLGTVVTIAGIAAASALTTRLDSTEARNSTADRAALPSLIRSAMTANGITGAGPGQASASIAKSGALGNNGSSRLESGLGELLVGIGWPGTLMVLGVVAVVCARGLRRPDTTPAAAAAAALLVAASGFNAFEGHPKVFVLLGVLLVLAQRPIGAEPIGSRCSAASVMIRRSAVRRMVAS